MKHIIRCFFVLAIILIFTGCTLQHSVGTAPAITGNSTVPSATGVQGWQSLPTFTTLEAYDKYIEDGVDAETFLTYEEVKTLGDFVCFVDTGRPKCHEYLYGLADDNGYHFSLFVYPLTKVQGESSDFGDIPPSLAQQDMRTNHSNAESFSINGIHYMYYNENLHSISWNTPTHRFVIEQGRTEPLSAYPANKHTTFLYTLLNSETAEAAVAEFNASIAQALAEKAK